MVSTPDRVYNFSADTKEEMEEWMNAFREAIESEPLDASQYRKSPTLSSDLSKLSVA